MSHYSQRYEVNPEIERFEGAFSKYNSQEDWEEFLLWILRNNRNARRYNRLNRDLQWFVTNWQKSGWNVKKFMKWFQEHKPLKHKRLYENIEWLKRMADQFGLNPETVVWNL